MGDGHTQSKETSSKCTTVAAPATVLTVVISASIFIGFILIQIKQPNNTQAGAIENEYSTDDLGEPQYDSGDVQPMNVVYAESAADPYTKTSLFTTLHLLAVLCRSFHQAVVYLFLQ